MHFCVLAARVGCVVVVSPEVSCDEAVSLGCGGFVGFRGLCTAFCGSHGYGGFVASLS